MKNTITVHNVSLKNLRHHKSRTLLTVGTVALAVALIFVVLTYFTLTTRGASEKRLMS